MSNSNNNQINIPQAREAMDRFKMQAAQEVGVNLTNCFAWNGYRQASSCPYGHSDNPPQNQLPQGLPDRSPACSTGGHPLYQYSPVPQ